MSARSRNRYETLVRPGLFLLDPERAHDFALSWLRRASTTPALLSILKKFRPPDQPQTLFGIKFANPIGLAAGFDKNGVALPALAAMGFGFLEIGTVTARAQTGNPKPRMFRFSAREALINRLGFNNEGADMVANRLRQLRESNRWPDIPVGINIGKSKVTPIDEATADYLHSFRRLRPYADYVVLNVSSPNTPGLRKLQASAALSSLLHAVQDENRSAKPIVVKIAPDLGPADLEEIIAACQAHEVAAIIATNTTLDHSAIPREQDKQGGLSGAPLREKATALIRQIADKCDIPIIGCGGILDAASAREKIEAGASLLQIYTGLIYRGPGLLREIAAAQSSHTTNTKVTKKTEE